MKKNKYYTAGDGNVQNVDDYIFEKIGFSWKEYPQELKEKKSLLSIAKYVPVFDREIYSSNVLDINQNTNSDFSEYISPIKEFALAQINYAKDYFPSDGEYWQFCKSLMQLPDDKKSVYDFLNKYSMMNLNYIPNKIRLIDDYMSEAQL